MQNLNKILSTSKQFQHLQESRIQHFQFFWHNLSLSLNIFLKYNQHFKTSAQFIHVFSAAQKREFYFLLSYFWKGEQLKRVTASSFLLHGRLLQVSYLVWISQVMWQNSSVPITAEIVWQFSNCFVLKWTALLQCLLMLLQCCFYMYRSSK